MSKMHEDPVDDEKAKGVTSVIYIGNIAFYIWAVIVAWNVVFGTDFGWCDSGYLSMPVLVAALILASGVLYIVVQSFRGELESALSAAKAWPRGWWIWYKAAPRTATLFIFVFVAAVLQYTVRYSVQHYESGGNERVRVTDRLWQTTTTSEYVGCSGD